MPIECVVRGYLAGSGWKEYQRSGTVCGIRLPPGLRGELPAARADLHAGHQGGDGPRREHLASSGRPRSSAAELAEELRRRSLDVFRRGAEYALERGIIIADTKFEFGQVDGRLLLIDEVLTPDSSRFWPADQYAPGRAQPSFDKQFVRDWLSASGWDKNSPPPALPDDIVAKTRAKYVEAYERLTGRKFGSEHGRKQRRSVSSPTVRRRQRARCAPMARRTHLLRGTPAEWTEFSGGGHERLRMLRLTARPHQYPGEQYGTASSGPSFSPISARRRPRARQMAASCGSIWRWLSGPATWPGP